MKTFAAFAISLLIAGTASANQFRFAYTQKDFASPAAVASLHERIQTKAQQYCSKQFFKTRHLGQVEGCVESVVSQVKQGIDGGRRVAQIDAAAQLGS
jgi:UrcA family protein